MKFTTLILGCIPILVVLVFSVFVNYQLGIADWHESGRYLPHYLGNKPLVNKIFDYEGTDFYYRPRELGSFFNLINSYLLVLFARFHLTNFLSPINYLTIVAIVIIPILVALQKKKHVYEFVFVAVLLGIAFFLSPAPFFTGPYSRTSKNVISLLSVCMFWLLHQYSLTKKTTPYAIISFVLLVAMGITDEYGIIMLCIFLFYLIFAFLRGPDRKRFLPLFVSFMGSIAVIFLYRRFVSPAITASVMGFYPEQWGETTFTTADMPLIPQGFSILMIYLNGLTGSVGNWLSYLLMIAVTGILTRSSLSFVTKNHGNVFSKTIAACTPLLGIGTIAFVSVLIAVMMKSFPDLSWLNTQIYYYPLPFVTLWFMVVMAACFHFLSVIPNGKFILFPLIVTVILLNISRINFYQQQMSGYLDDLGLLGAAHPVIQAIEAPSINEAELNAQPGRDTILLFRKKLGK